MYLQCLTHCLTQHTLHLFIRRHPAVRETFPFFLIYLFIYTLFIRMQSDCYLIHWVTIHLLLLHCVQLFVTSQTVACQAPLSMGPPRQEHWSGLPCPPPGDLPSPGMEPKSPALVGGFSTMEPPRKPHHLLLFLFILVLKLSHILPVGASFKMPISFHHDSTFWGSTSLRFWHLYLPCSAPYY